MSATELRHARFFCTNQGESGCAPCILVSTAQRRKRLRIQINIPASLHCKFARPSSYLTPHASQLTPQDRNLPQKNLTRDRNAQASDLCKKHLEIHWGGCYFKDIVQAFIHDVIKYLLETRVAQRRSCVSGREDTPARLRKPQPARKKILVAMDSGLVTTASGLVAEVNELVAGSVDRPF